MVKQEFEKEMNLLNITEGKERLISAENNFPVWKNLFVLSTSFFFFSSATIGVNSIQSSVNFDDGLGVTATSIHYGIGVPAVLFLGAIITRIFGLKHTIIIGMGTQTVYFMANMYPSKFTMIPSAVLTGVLTPCAWIAKNAYVGHIGALADERSGKTTSVDRFFGIYYLFYYFSNIFGTIFGYFVMEVNKQTATQENVFCGIDFCDYLTSTNGTNFESISELKRYTLFGGYIGMAVVALLLNAFFLDQVRLGLPLKGSEYARLSLVTLFQFGNKNQILLTFANFYRGVSTSFMAADFTKAFVTCQFGASNLEFVMMTYGIACGVGSFVFSHLEKRVGRLPIFFCFVSTHATFIIAMFTWMADPQDKPLTMYLAMAALWGIGQSVLEYQIAGLQTYLFPDKLNEAFNAFQLPEDLGESLCYGLSGLICFTAKLYIISILLALATGGYLLVVIRMKIYQS